MSNEITSPKTLMEIITGFRVSRIILTGFELGIFTILGSSEKSSGQVAENLSLAPRSTDRLMNALAAIGLLTKKNNLFSNTAFSSKFLVKGSPAYMGGISHMVNTWRTWNTLTDAVKVGTTVAIDPNLGDRGDAWLEPFIAAMHQRAVPQAVEVANVLDFSKVKKILDIGGGSGAFSFEFLKRCNGANAVIFDLPTVVPITRKYIDQSGLGNSVVTVTGDYLVDQFGVGFDMIYISAVIHINSPDENLDILRKSAAALNPGGQVVIMDHIMSEDRTEPRDGAIFAINMLAGTKHGDVYTEGEIKSWMTDAGLKKIKRIDAVSGSSLMVGYK